MPEPDHLLANVAKLFSLGRPLWGPYLKSGLLVMELVRVGEKILSEYESTSKRTRDLALLCMRVNYYVGQYSLAEDLVSNCLRFIISVTEERDTLMSVQPREPLLAYVSSRLLADPSARLNALRSWESCFASGSVNPGDIGEQIAILVLLFAFDDACQPFNELPGPISFLAFWTALFGADRILPDNNDNPLTDSSVFFNHFIRVSAPPSQAVIEESYRRGAAIFLPAFYKGADALIPLKTPNGIGAILVQVKNRQDDKLTSKLEESLKGSIKDGIEALLLEEELPGGYFGMGI